MKVLLVNGSPNKDGCTFTALTEVAGALQKNGVETEIFHIGRKPVHGCIGCGRCAEIDRCTFDDDVCNEMAAKMTAADGIVIGSPVYYAGPNGALCALLDRVFYSNSHKLANKPATAVVSCRRGGSTAAFDRLNKYFTISRMPVVTSQYWNMVHGLTPEDVRKDHEGMQIMRILGNDMAWMLKSIKEGKQQLPETEPRVYTNFVR
jgi:multimeric flavodoxin WrbA